MTTTTTRSTIGATDKQVAFLRQMMAKCYDAPTIDRFCSDLTKESASAAIQKMIDAGYGDRPRQTARPARTSGKATDAQIAYAERLIAAGNWYDSDAGQGFDPPTAAALRRMSRHEISALINDLKG